MVKQTASLFASMWVKLRLRKCKMFVFYLTKFKNTKDFRQEGYFNHHTHRTVWPEWGAATRRLQTCRTLNTHCCRHGAVIAQAAAIIWWNFILFFFANYFSSSQWWMDVQVQKNLHHKHDDKPVVPPAAEPLCLVSVLSCNFLLPNTRGSVQQKPSRVRKKTQKPSPSLRHKQPQK